MSHVVITPKKRISTSTLVPNSLLFDNRLSLAAMGLASILETTTGPQTIEEIQTRTPDSEETIRMAADELAALNYVVEVVESSGESAS